MENRWVTSLGGPLILIPQSACQLWNGVLDAEKVIEHGRDAVQDSLALGEDELALGDDMVHSLHNGCPYAGLNRMAETAHAVGDLGVVLDEAVAVEESGDLRPVSAHHYQLDELPDQL